MSSVRGGARKAYLLHFFPPDGEPYYLSVTGYNIAKAHEGAAKHLARRGTPDVPYNIEQQRPSKIRGPW
jgi:hypothetical protein